MRAFLRGLLVLSILGAASSGLAADATPKAAISAFFSGWIRWAPDSRVDVGDPLDPAARYPVYPVVRKSSIEKLNDRLATVWDGEKKELFVGEVFSAPDAKSTEPFDPEAEGAILKKQLADMSRTETGIRRTPDLDRPGLFAYRVVFRTPVGPYGQPVFASADRTLMLIGSFVPASTDPHALRKERLARIAGPRKGNGSRVLHEFLDLQCPRCAVRSAAITKFLAENPELDVAVEMHHFPLYPDHSWAVQAAQGAACLGTLGSEPFFAHVDTIFGVQATTTEESARAAAKDLAESLGRTAEFDACLSTRKGDARVLGDLETGLSAGVRTTPSFVVDGVLIPNDDGLLERYLRESTRRPAPDPKAGKKKGSGKR